MAIIIIVNQKQIKTISQKAKLLVKHIKPSSPTTDNKITRKVRF